MKRSKQPWRVRPNMKTRKHQKLWINIFLMPDPDCVRMTLVSSRDSVKSRMSRTLLSCLIVDHWPKIRIGIRIRMVYWKSLFRDLFFSGLNPYDLNLTPTCFFLQNLPTSILPSMMVGFFRWRSPLCGQNPDCPHNQFGLA
jgi:hypothetical protein